MPPRPQAEKRRPQAENRTPTEMDEPDRNLRLTYPLSANEDLG